MPKPSDLFEGENSTLAKTFREVIKPEPGKPREVELVATRHRSRVIAQENGKKIIEIAKRLGIGSVDLIDACQELNELPKIYKTDEKAPSKSKLDAIIQAVGEEVIGSPEATFDVLEQPVSPYMKLAIRNQLRAEQRKKLAKVLGE